MLLSCLETAKWRTEFLNNKWWNMNEVVAYKKMLSCINKVQAISLGVYLDTVKYKWFNKIKDI